MPCLLQYHYARADSVCVCVLLSTLVSFGMGVNKPNVRLVLHYGPPDSLEAYYQQAGRAVC
jgi:superfamily II DNA helicase RecQ